jgi:hypothetical protein
VTVASLHGGCPSLGITWPDLRRRALSLEISGVGADLRSGPLAGFVPANPGNGGQQRFAWMRKEGPNGPEWYRH